MGFTPLGQMTVGVSPTPRRAPVQHPLLDSFGYGGGAGDWTPARRLTLTDTQGEPPQVSLGQGGLLVFICRQVPLLIYFGGAFSLISMAWFAEEAFGITFLVLNVYMMYWMLRTALGGLVGLWKVRNCRNRDWGAELALLKTMPQYTDVQHFVIIPNYKEDLEVLNETVQCWKKQPALLRAHIHRLP